MNVLRANSFLLSLAAACCGLLGWTAQGPAGQKLGVAAPAVSAGAFTAAGVLGVLAVLGIVAVLKQKT